MTSDQPQFGHGPFSGAPQGTPGLGQTQPGQAAPQYGQGAGGGYAPPPGGGYGPPPGGGYGPPQYGQAGPYGRVSRGTNSLAIAALCCGIGQLIAGPFAGIPAIILGFMSLGQIRQTGEDGRGMAITGLVLGIVGVVLTVLIVLLVVAVAHNVSTSSSMVPAA